MLHLCMNGFMNDLPRNVFLFQFHEWSPVCVCVFTVHGKDTEEHFNAQWLLFQLRIKIIHVAL